MRRAVLLATLVLAGCGGGGETVDRTVPPNFGAVIKITSPALRKGAEMPTRFTCDGRQISPPLRFGGVPAGSKELVLTMEDPDAPNGTFVHAYSRSPRACLNTGIDPRTLSEFVPRDPS